MKVKKIMAAVLAAGIGLTGFWQTDVAADTVIVEEDMEDGPEDSEAVELNWQMTQRLDVASCKQGKDVTLTVSVLGDTKSMQLSTIYATLSYNLGVFAFDAEDITPVKSGLVDYISFDEYTGELDIYYASDITIESGTELFKIKMHVLDDADTGSTGVRVDSLELYATDNDNYVMIENENKVKVNIQKGSGAVLLGDVNQDGRINLTDVKVIMRHCNKGTKLSEAQKKNADVNKDGKVSLTDAKLIMKYCNGQIRKF